MRIVRIGTLDFSQKNAVQDFPVSARAALVPLRYGAFDQDGALVILQSNKIRMQLLYIPPDIDGQMDEMNTLLQTGTQVMQLAMRDGIHSRVTYAKLTSTTRPVDANTYDFMQDVTYEFTTQYPYWWDAAQIQFLDTGLTLDSGVVADGNYIAQAMTASPLTFSVTYGGSGRGSYGAFCIAPRAASSLADFQIENLTNGMNVRYTGTVNANQRLDIDWLTKTVTLDGDDVYANFSIDDPKQIELFVLEPRSAAVPSGGNNIKVTGTVVGTVDFYLQWADQFI